MASEESQWSTEYQAMNVIKKERPIQNPLAPERLRGCTYGSPGTRMFGLQLLPPLLHLVEVTPYSRAAYCCGTKVACADWGDLGLCLAHLTF